MIATPKHLGGHENRTHVDSGALACLVRLRKVESVLDVGCGPGGMVYEASRMGLNVVGVDGDPALNYDGEYFVCHDFTEGPMKLGRSALFDLGWSVEFLEHLEERFLCNVFPLFERCRLVAITAAPPGIPGHHHVNCQDAGYWISLFYKYGFLLDHELTASVRSASTMRRGFMREHGLVFARTA